MTFPMFWEMLRILHKGREEKSPRPWLQRQSLPQWILDASPRDLEEVIVIMNSTKFCHPDRFQDRVSLELQEVLRSVRCSGRAAAIALAVRYKCSPAGLATALAGRPPTKFDEVVREHRRAHAVYRQTGQTDEQLAGGIRNAGDALALELPFTSWEKLEDTAAELVREHCHGEVLEGFCARQAAADLFRLGGWVKNSGKNKRPLTSRLGTGARAGFWLGERAAGKRRKHCKPPATLPYEEQTVRCEYSKLVKRLNFPDLCKKARYTPHVPPNKRARTSP